MYVAFATEGTLAKLFSFGATAVVSFRRGYMAFKRANEYNLFNLNGTTLGSSFLHHLSP